MGGFLVSSKAELKRKEKAKKKAKSGGFESLGLSPNVFRAIKGKGYRVPTPIQRKTMPLILLGADVVAMARTGSGKTAAFLIPMIEKLKQHVPQAGVRALILSPTRELALQTLKFTKEFSHYTDLHTSLLVGGYSMESQFEELAQNPDIIVATPGRLMHHLTEVDDMSLRTVEYVVFDEADSLFDKGFGEELHKILAQLSENRQTLLFTATLPKNLAEFARAGLRDPQIIRLDKETTISPDTKLVFFTMRHEEKYAALLFFIRERVSSDEQTMVFVSTRHHVEFLKLLFELDGVRSSTCYSDMHQDAREINISRFRSRKTMLLITTDCGAKGLDIPLLDNVVNWDFPATPKLFVHRVGRVGRAGRSGTAYSFMTSDDMAYFLDLHLFLAKPIRAAPTEEEVLKDPKGVMDKTNLAISEGATVYGRFPQTDLGLVQDKIRGMIDSSADLSALLRACTNGFKAYKNQRNHKHCPSKESIRRVKDLPHEGLHPMFANAIEGNEMTALAFSERLKFFRPKQTVLEAEGEVAKAKHLRGPSSKWVAVMKMKRAVHDQTIDKVQQQHSSDDAIKEIEPNFVSAKATETKEHSGTKRKAQSFRDEEYFICPVPTNKHLEDGLSMRGGQSFGSNRLESAVMDMVADDTAGIQKQRTMYHWDKKGKKYIKLNNGERVTASGKVKTEGGKKVKAQKTGIYQKWKANTHSKIALKGGTNNDVGVVGQTSLPGGRFNQRFKGGGRQQRSIPNADVPSEIKNLEQVRKERQKATRESYIASKSNKGGSRKFGKNGKGGSKFGKNGKKRGKAKQKQGIIRF